jgi:hypothetical protein
MRLRVLATVAGLVVVLAAACGTDERDGSSSSHPTFDEETEPVPTQPPPVPTTANPCPFFSCVPVTPAPAPPREPEPVPRGNCDPNYSDCVPPYPPDVDCPDIGHQVQVLGSDPHRLDADGDGVGCDIYG